MKGTVVKLLGKVCIVQGSSPNDHPYECYLRGRLFEKPGVQFAIGDRVEFDPVEEFHPEGGRPDHFTGVIHEILPRRTALTRPSRKRGGAPQVIAANVDQMIVVSALKRPSVKFGLIDRYLVLAERAGISPALCLNKTDLGTAAELEAMKARHQAYVQLGIPLFMTSAVRGDGLEDLKQMFQDKCSVMVGHSGVGKSKLAGRVQPGLSLASSHVARTGRGRHTTTAAVLISLDFGGQLVDTPGVRELGLKDVHRDELASHFVELKTFLGKCRFHSCSHIPEPECAIKEAMEKGQISRARYASYVHIYHELGDSG